MEGRARLLFSAVTLLAAGLFSLTWFCQDTANDLDRQTAELQKPISELFESALEHVEPVSIETDEPTTW